MQPAEITALEDVAARAVPAAQAVTIDGWIARRSPGLRTRRVNSVLARAHSSAHGLDGSLAAVEHAYARWDQPARFQLTPASAPHGLQAALVSRGYTTSPETAVSLCPLAELAERADVATPPVTTEVSAAPTPPWWDTWGEASDLIPARMAAAGALFTRIEPATGFAVAILDRRPVAVGLGVHDGDWLGIFNMATLPGMRRRGAARAVMSALAGWAASRGARTAYLQVEVGNDPARRMYGGLGFREAYRYRYLTQTAAP